MAAGDLIVKDHQYEFNGLLLGSGTDYLVENWDGMFDGGLNMRSNDLDRNDDDGVVPGLDFTGGRTLTGTLHLIPDVRANAWAMAQQFATAFQRRTNTEIPFCFRHPATNGAIYQINCRPRNYAMPKDYELAMGHGFLAVQLFASKPEFYNRVVNSIAGLNQSAVQTSTAAAFNYDGNYPTGPVITITGPVAAGSTLTVSGQSAYDGYTYNGFQFKFNTALATGSTLVIDFKNKTVKLNGTAKYSYRASGSAWWELLPGNNMVTLVRAAAGAAMTCSLTYSDAWML